MREIKNRNLLKIKNSKIELKIEDCNNYYIIDLYIDSLTAPSQRPRISIKGGDFFYDPLSSYKNYIRKKIGLQLNKDFNIIEGPIYINITYSMIPPLSWSKIKRYEAIKHYIQPTVKPDNDNIEKTMYDIFNKLLWKDDNQIIENNTIKVYNINEYTHINIVGYKKPYKSDKRRLTKEILNSLTKEEENFLNKKEV